MFFLLSVFFRLASSLAFVVPLVLLLRSCRPTLNNRNPLPKNHSKRRYMDPIVVTQEEENAGEAEAAEQDLRQLSSAATAAAADAAASASRKTANGGELEMPPRRQRSSGDEDGEDDEDDEGDETESDSDSEGGENDAPEEARTKQQQQQQPQQENPDTALRLRAVADLERHFESVQSICDGVTLPQALADLRATFAQAAADVAEAEVEAERESSSSDPSSSSSPSSSTTSFPPDVDALALLLRSGTLPGEDKLRAWRALRRASLARAVAAPWALSALALRTRVALNVLGRHLFLAAHVPPPPPAARTNGRLVPAAAAAAASNSVSKAAQERFLEWGHALPRRGAARLQRVASRAADSAFARFDLATEVCPEDVLKALSEAHSAVETALLMTAASSAAKMKKKKGSSSGSSNGSGATAAAKNGDENENATAVTLWRDLLLPAPEEADRFFSEAALAAAAAAAAAEGVPPPPFAANSFGGGHPFPASVAADDALVRGMASELAAALCSPRFSSAAACAARGAAGAAAKALQNALSPPAAASGDDGEEGDFSPSFSLPFARVVPRAAAVGGALFDPDSAPCADALKRVAASPEVMELCAAVYSGML